MRQAGAVTSGPAEDLLSRQAVGSGAGLPQASARAGVFEPTRWGAWPALGFAAVFFLLPLAIMVCVSFLPRGGGLFDSAWTLDNYVKFLTRSYLTSALYNSLQVSVAVTCFSLLIAYPFAYVLAFHVPARWQKILLVLAVLPFWTSYVVRSYSWLLVIGDNGVLNSWLLAIGAISEPIKIAYTRTATVLGFVHFFAMLLTLTIYANLSQINPSYVKAARDLGAPFWRVLVHIILPLSLPGVMVGAFLTFVITIGDYITPQILGGNTELLLPQAIMLQIVRSADFPMASVMSLVLMAVVAVVYLGVHRQMKMERM
jgi:spermidine/putrescine transport system permease protein